MRKTSTKKRVGMLVVALSLVLLASMPSYGAEKFYRGKVVVFTCPYKPGGGFDTYSRVIAKHLPKYIPAKAVIVKNVVGAGGLTGTNKLYVARANGLTIGITNTPGMIIPQILGTKGVRFDVAKFSWLSRIVAESHVIVVGKNAPYRTIDDFRKTKKTVVFSATGMGSDDYLGAAIIAEAMGFPLRQVTGYETSAESNLAVLKGDVDGTEISLPTILPLIKNGDVRPILQVGLERDPQLPDVPTALEVVSQDKKDMVVGLTSIFASGRGVAGPPGIPKGQLTLLREALDKVFHDDDFIQELKKRGRPLTPLAGEKLENLMKECMATAEKIKPILKKALEKK